MAEDSRDDAVTSSSSSSRTENRGGLTDSVHQHDSGHSSCAHWQGPIVQTVTKAVEVAQVQLLVSVVNMPVVVQIQVPVRTIQKTVKIQQL